MCEDGCKVVCLEVVCFVVTFAPHDRLWVAVSVRFRSPESKVIWHVGTWGISHHPPAMTLLHRANKAHKEANFPCARPQALPVSRRLDRSSGCYLQHGHCATTLFVCAAPGGELERFLPRGAVHISEWCAHAQSAGSAKSSVEMTPLPTPLHPPLPARVAARRSMRRTAISWAAETR